MGCSCATMAWDWPLSAFTAMPGQSENTWNDFKKEKHMSRKKIGNYAIEGMVYEYVIVKFPTVKEYENGTAPEIVAGPKTLWAGDRDTAAALAGKDLLPDVPESRQEVFIRPFGGMRQE